VIGGSSAAECVASKLSPTEVKPGELSVPFSVASFAFM